MIASMNTVIDEMLFFLFRGRFPFMLWKKKPGKYGILIKLLADCEQQYCINMEVCSGKRPGLPSVKRLIAPINNMDQNVTTMTITILLYYANKQAYYSQGIETDRIEPKCRPLYSSLFAYTELVLPNLQ